LISQGLVGNILRWAIGPYVLRGGRPETDEESERQPLLEDPRDGHDEPLVDAIDEEESLKKRVPKKALAGAEEFCEHIEHVPFPEHMPIDYPLCSQSSSYCGNPCYCSWSNQANSMAHIR